MSDLINAAQKAENLAKEAIASYLHAANPLAPGDTRKLLQKMSGVIDRQIKSLDLKAANRLVARINPP